MGSIEERILVAVQFVRAHDHMTVQIWQYKLAQLFAGETDVALVSVSGYVFHNGLEQFERQSEQRDRLWDALLLQGRFRAAGCCFARISALEYTGDLSLLARDHRLHA